MNFYIHTFGCQMNEYDSARMAEMLTKKCYNEVKDYVDADIVILNTCSIREKATHKIYSELGRINLVKQKMRANDRYMAIVVIGCVASVEGEKIFKHAPYVDIILSPQAHANLFPYLQKVFNSVQKITSKDGKSSNLVATETHLADMSLDANSKFDFLAEEREKFNGVSAYITIQEGCNKFCTYCVVPNTRGRELARPAVDIINEAKSIVKQGAKEIVLLGQNVSSYKYNDGSKTFTLVDLVHEIAKLPEVCRIRYITSHPRDMTDEIIEMHKNEPKLMPYLHLPVQSGSTEILKKMNRKYTQEMYLDLIKKFREAVPNIVFSSDFIVAFPGETDENFEDTMKLVEEVNYQAQCFSFIYSPRPNTTAATMKDQIPENIASDRLNRLQDLLEQQRMDFCNSLVGKIVNVLFDNKNMQKPDQICGRDDFMHLVVLENQIEEQKNELYGTIRKVKITKVNANVLNGEIVE